MSPNGHRQPVGVIGVGYVGLVTAVCFADLGYEVVCLDVNEERIAGLRAGRVPIYEPGVDRLLARNRSRLTFTLDLDDVLRRCRIIFVCVDTPATHSGDADLSRVRAVINALPATGERFVLVMKSTVPVGTGEKVREDMNARGLGHVGYAANPEFLREGRAVADFMEPDRIVIGAFDAADASAVASLYKDVRAPVITTDVASAEMIKYASNAFLATKISFINEIANVCEEVGADVAVVAQGMGLDVRIGTHFLRPGIGYGGSCFPKDVKALKQLAGNSGYHFQLLTSVIEVNDLQKRRVVGKLERHLGSLRGTRVALLGLAFKADTDDMREASSLVLAARLRAEGATVIGYDPVAMENAAAMLGEDVELAGLDDRGRHRRRCGRDRDGMGRVPAGVLGRRARGDAHAARRRRPQPARPRAGARGRVRIRVGGAAVRSRRSPALRGRRGRRRSVIAVILVGGEGTRLRPLTYDTPKPMLPIANRPFLEHQIEHLRRHGVDRIRLACGYRPDAIRAHFGDALEYVVEPEPLGTGGAIGHAARGLRETFVVANGDVLTDLDLTALVGFHRERGAR